MVLNWTDHVKEATITLTMRLDDTAQPVAYNFRSGGDDASHPDRALSSWVLYGSADGVNWDICDVVKNLPAVKSNNAWYNGTIAEGANKGNFQIALLTNEARGALTFKCGPLPGRAVPQVTLHAYGVGANSASVVLDWSKTGDFTDSITTDPVAIEGEAQLGVPVALSVPDGLEAGATYQVRARVTNAKNVEATFGPVCTTLAASDVSGYLKRADFKVDYDADDEAMDDFRVLVRLAEGQPSGFTYEQCAADGSDLVFTSADGSMAYFFDVDTWNPQGESCIWVRLPRAKKGDAFSMYYGKSGATSKADAAGTWSGYKGVWHMSETITAETAATTKSKNAAGDAALDANPTHGNQVDDTKLAQMVSTDGVVGNARVNGTENGGNRCYLSVPSYDGVGDTFTLSGWFNAYDVSGYPRLFSRKHPYDAKFGFECEMSGGSKTTASVRGASGTSVNFSFDDITKNWLHMTFVYAGKTLTVYVNGVQKETGGIDAVSDISEPLSFGNNSNGSEATLNGRYDEIRLQKGVLRADRVKAEYATMTDATFLSCAGVVSTDPDMPNLESAAVAWENDATTVSLVLKAGVGDASIVFTDVLSGQVYTIDLAKGLDAREEVKTVSYPLTAEQLPPDATYSWVVTVANGKFDRPAKIVGESKYYSGAADPTVRYVSKTGSDENNGMLLSSAKATLQAAIDALGAEGGTVYIDDGDYAFTSETETAVKIETPVKVIGLSRDASKVMITRMGTPTRNFWLANADCGLYDLTVVGGSYGNNSDQSGISIRIDSGNLERCVIRDAYRVEWNGQGAVNVQAGATTHISRCIFVNNTAQNYASALLMRSGIAENCLFYGNHSLGASDRNGSTVAVEGTASLVNCTIAGNDGSRGSGVNIGQWATSKVINCAIFGNTSENAPDDHIHVWNGSNAKDRIYNCASELEINESCLVVTPGFRDTKNNDYSLSSASGLVDQGATYEDTGATSETDLAGNARLVDNVDIGCYEYTKADLDVGFTASVSEGLVPMTVEFTASVFGAKGDVSYDWDFDNDGKVDETTTTPTVSYVYQTAGVKTIGLTITSGGATARATLIDAIKVSPVVVFADSANAENAAFPYDTLETATPDLALAIATAGNGSKILVADGTYTATGTYGFEVSKDLRIESISGNPANCILSAQGNGTHRAMSLNHPSALVAGLTMQDGYISDHAAGATLLFRDLGGVVSNCVIKLGSARGWDGDGALASVSTSGRITHSILEQGLCHGDQQADQKTSCLKILGQVDNCLIRDCNRGADNQNIVMVYAGGKLLNCTIVDGLCNTTTRDGRTTDCVGVRADTGARVENCVIVGVRHQESDETFSVRAWNGDAAAFVNCATDTAEPINGTCVTVTTAAFRDYAAKDYRPASGSPLIGKGKKNELADGTDLVGNRRASGAMDIGCYEAKSGFIVYVH